MADLKNDWYYPLLETTLDKRVSRIGVPTGASSGLTGVDGRSEGGLQPFPGFRKVHTMAQLKNQTNHSYLSRVIDFKPVDFRIGSEHYGYGFVYRAKRGVSKICDVFLDYWDSVTEAWTYCTKLVDAVDEDQQFDVQVAGRFIYSFIAGRSPALFYIEATNVKVYELEANSYIDGTATTTNYAGDLVTNKTLKLKGTSPSTYTNNTLLRFDTSAEFGKNAESASLEFTVSSNTTVATPSLSVRAINDPLNNNVGFNSAQVTWNNRTNIFSWQSGGGDSTATNAVNIPLAVGYLGRIVLDVTALVNNCLDKIPQDFSAKTDLLIRGFSGGNLISIASLEQPNYSIRPRLTVTYSDKVFLNPVIIGDTSGGSIPGPGVQPSLSSPERGIAPGSFTSLDTGHVGAGQVVLMPEDPYINGNNFPDQGSGLCVGDSFPATSPVAAPGGAYAHSPTAGACTTYLAAGFLTQLLSPAMFQTNVSLTPKLDWTSYYSTGQDLASDMKWDVYLVEEGRGTLDTHMIVQDLTVTKYEPASLFPLGKLSAGKKYLWKVVAKRLTCADFLVPSTTGTFTTENKYLARKFEPGDYSFGYVLVNSKTGRRSSFSEVAQVRSEDFTVTRLQGGNNISINVDQYMGIELVYDSEKFDLMYVYRSVKTQDAGGTMMSGIPFLDAVVPLLDYQTCKNGTGRTFDPATTDNRHAMYFYELEDKQLVYQNPYTDRSVFDETMPYGGTAMFYQNTMLVSQIKNPDPSSSEEARPEDVNRGLGEMRWSSLTDVSPELFPPFNRYNPSIPSNEVVCFSKAGANVLGLSLDRVYHIRKSGPYIKVTEMHEGYGIVNPKAVDTVGSASFYVTSHGIKSVDVQGQLDEVRNLNSVFVDEWKNDLLTISMAHDPLTNCLFILNPVKEEVYTLWFSTGRTTKLEDANFSLVSQGPWPTNWTSVGDAGNTLCRRAFFLQNIQETRASGTGTTLFPGPAVYIMDHGGTRTISGGSALWNTKRRITMLDFNGDSRFVASGNWDVASKFIPFSSGTGTVVANLVWQYAYIYLTDSTANPSLIGSKAKVMYNLTTGVFIDSTQPNQGWVTSVVTGDVFVVSPVVFEWAGHPLGLSPEQRMSSTALSFAQTDLFKMKVASSVGAAFVGVSGPPLTDTVTAASPLARFAGLLFSGSDLEPFQVSQTWDPSGGLYESVNDGAGLVYAAFGSDTSDGKYGAKGNSLTPGIKILCPDLDFRLLGCIVRGTITTVERTSSYRGS